MAQAWEQVGPDRTAYDGFVRVLHRTMRLPDGRSTVWTVLDVPAVATVLALTPAREVVLVRQFRVGPMAQVLSLPGGLIDDGEDPVTAGERELREETGYEAGGITLVATLHQNSRTRPGHTLVALDCVPSGEQQLDDFEDCEVVVVPLAEFRSLLRSGQITTAEQAYLGLDSLGLL